MRWVSMVYTLRLRRLAASLFVLPSASSLQDFPLPRGQQFVRVFDVRLLELAHVVFHQDAADGGAEERLCPR